VKPLPRSTEPNKKTGKALPCDACGARCCSYVAIEIGRPTSKSDYDHIRWYLAHESVNVFVDHENKWYVEFRTPCANLGEKQECLIYPSRPGICRDHPGLEWDCEYFDSPYRHYFSTMKQFEKFLSAKGVDWKYRAHE